MPQAQAQEPPKKPLPPQEPVRPAVFAGMWYPKDPKALREMVVGFLDGAKKRPLDKRVVALISPHAGFKYSGPVAGEAYASVRGKKFDTVILVGISHRGPLDGISVVPKGSYDSPLGAVPIDEGMATSLLKNDSTGRIRHQPEAHAQEHGLESQIPFLQVALKDPFRIVPILIRARDPDDYAVLSDAVDWVVDGSGKKVLLVASSDLSHFPAHADAVKPDREIMEAAASLDPRLVLAKDREILRRNIPGMRCTMCGLDAVVAVILAAKALGGKQARILDVRNSFQVTGRSEDRVVGYGAMAILAGEGEGLSMRSKRMLIAIARESAEAALGGGEPKFPAAGTIPVELKAPRGAFVTLKNPKRKHSLRGCLGTYNLDGANPLYAVVMRMAVSATKDSRFVMDPVTLEEMKGEIRVEISVLSPFRRVEDPGDITLGIHGVSLVWDGMRRSVYLPQVATENAWGLDKFLSRLCVKGGLPPDAWKDRKRMRFDLFTAEVFHE